MIHHQRGIQRRKAVVSSYSERAPSIMRKLVQGAKITTTDAAAIAGNIGQESSFNPSAVGRAGDYGLCQWTGVRKSRLFAVAKKLGLQPNSEDAQINYLIWELQNTHRHALRALVQSGTLAQKTIRFCNTFEVPSPRYANYNKRVVYANDAYAAYRKVYGA